MVPRVRLILAGLGTIFAGTGVTIWFSSARWNARTSQYRHMLGHAPPGREEISVKFNEFEQLPAPVGRYFRRALTNSQTKIRSLRILQVGQFRMAEDRWRPFQATQYFSAQPPGFVWDASIRMAPLINVRVRDAYVAGRASMEAKILSLVPVVAEHGKAELNAGALQRYLAEAVWFPTALLPTEGVKWAALDNSRALATLSDFSTTVSLEFRFNDVGEITGVFAPGRYREVNGKYELTPWEGRFRSYRETEGMRIPLEAEVEWRLQGNRFPYWKGRIVEAVYEFAR